MRRRAHPGAVLVLLAGVVAGLLAGCSGKAEALPLCTAGEVVLTPEQAANAATIAGVARRMQMPDHAVTVALATAFQESGLRNLTYGDRDSLGLFQQRPSQGWGTAVTVQTPRLAAASFYRHLKRIPGWEALPLTEAAQRVQHSAAPDAYAQWENAARELARALTGQVPAGLACAFEPTPRPDRLPLLEHDAALDLGPDGLTPAQASIWVSASWLVAHATSYGLSKVAVAGQAWTAQRGTWQRDPKATTLVWS